VRISVSGGTNKLEERICCLGVLGWDLDEDGLEREISRCVSAFLSLSFPTYLTASSSTFRAGRSEQVGGRRSIRVRRFRRLDDRERSPPSNASSPEQRRFATSPSSCLLRFLTNLINLISAVLIASSAQNHLIVALFLSNHLELRKEQHRSIDLSASQHIRKMDDPHLQAVWRYGLTGDWEDCLDEAEVPLMDRLAIALRFMPDSAVREPSWSRLTFLGRLGS
jgi:hypothetical protein